MCPACAEGRCEEADRQVRVLQGGLPSSCVPRTAHPLTELAGTGSQTPLSPSSAAAPAPHMQEFPDRPGSSRVRDPENAWGLRQPATMEEMQEGQGGTPHT